ncbi:MAG: DNA photolyase family protein [Vampirovibrio sp.]|nr:DNA photolyase family protein [Vampirovibrio sp.]
MPTLPPIIIWIRQCFRLQDNPMLTEANRLGHPVIPIFILKNPTDSWSPGGATRWWLHQSLKQLQSTYQQLGAPLVLQKGDPVTIVSNLAEQHQAAGVFYDKCFEPDALQEEAQLAALLGKKRIPITAFRTNYLFGPNDVLNNAGDPYQVFTPYWKKSLQLPPPAQPVVAPKQIQSVSTPIESLMLEDLNLDPQMSWSETFFEYWQPGEYGAQDTLTHFLENGLNGYLSERDKPAVEGVSTLSPYLHFGEISPRQVWYVVKAWLKKDSSRQKPADGFLRQLIWREFATQMLVHRPDTVNTPLKEEFNAFPWEPEQSYSPTLKAWQQGRTGYPIVDAGMRQLWATGWMHNRVRMIVASFLVKDLFIPWQEGAKWFWDTLLDADLANNTFGWQWTAGCGADAAPYFRVFNPILQGEKFDPNGDYVKRWVPELAYLNKKWIHKPWEAPPVIREEAEVKAGKTYPNRIVDHHEARTRALASYQEIRAQKA